MTNKNSVSASLAGAAVASTIVEACFERLPTSPEKRGPALNWTVRVIFAGFLLLYSLSSFSGSLGVDIPLFLLTESGAKIASITGLKGNRAGQSVNDSTYNSATKTGNKITTSFSQGQSASGGGGTTSYATGTPSAGSPASASPGSSGDKDDDDDQNNRDKLPKGWQEPEDGDISGEEYRCEYCPFTGALTDVEAHERDCPHRNQINHILRDTPEAVAQEASSLLIDRISNFHPSPEHPYFVLVLPTGRTPERLYQLLIEAVRHEQVSLNQVVMFNMDEYIGASPGNPDSYNSYMHHHLLRHNPGFYQVYLYNGSLPPEQECINREQLFHNYGYIDLLLGGVGENGHIAFNEPGSAETSRTRRVQLTQNTIQVNSELVEGDSFTEAMTIGMANIMEAREVIILATGEKKQRAVSAALTSERTTGTPITLLQKHKKATLITDKAAIIQRQNLNR